MAFRFGDHGTISRQQVIWKCPTCGTENAGPLEQGCTACKAGADAKTPAQAARIVEAAPGPSVTAFYQWATQLGLDATRSELQEAWIAGARWARSQAAPAGNVPGEGEGIDAATTTRVVPVGGSLLATIDPITHDPTGLLDTRTHTTILAALAFYRDNTLSYGSVAGQLSAQEVTELLDQLTPKEGEA